MQKKLVDKLVEEGSENIDGNEMIYNETLNDYKNKCNSCKILYIVLFFIAFLIINGTSSAFICFNWYLKSDSNIADINLGTEAVIY